MPAKQLDEFGEMLMTRVRDKAILDWNRIASGQMKGSDAERVQHLLEAMTEADRRVFLSLVPAVVDTTLHRLLWMVEQDSRITVSMRRSTDGTCVNVAGASDGLSGELYGARGWIARFSEQENSD